MRMKRKWLRPLAAFTVLALVATACGGDDDDDDSTAGTTGGEEATTTTEAAGEEGGELIDGGTFPAVPPHIDPALTSELDGAQVSTALYDGLTEFDYADPASPELKGLVAESWESNDDATVWTFTLKSGLTFSDGEEVLPSSFARGWNRAADPELAADYSYLFLLVKGAQEWTDGTADSLTGVTADDEAMTLTVELAKPYAEFPAVVSHIIFSPMPAAVDDLSDQSEWEKGVMIGNGPFVMESPMTDQEIVLARNEEWGGDIFGNTRAKLDKITFKISKDIDSAFADFEAGNVMTSTIPSGRYGDALANYENTVTPVLGSYHFLFNMEDPVVGGEDNLKLRQAISMAIDRDAINQTVYESSRTISTGVTPPGVPGFEEGLCEFCVFDADAAKALFEEWQSDGGSLDEPIKIQFNEGAGHEDVVAIFQANLSEIGIETELDPRSSETYFDEMRDGGCQLCRAGWFWDYPVYDNGMYDLFHTDSIGGNNLGLLSDEEFDGLIADARQTVDDDQREELFRTAEKRLLNDLTAVVPVNWYNGDYVYADSVHNFTQNALGFVLWEQITVDQG